MICIKAFAFAALGLVAGVTSAHEVPQRAAGQAP
jgi:hypothetical protein